MKFRLLAAALAAVLFPATVSLAQLAAPPNTPADGITIGGTTVPQLTIDSSGNLHVSGPGISGVYAPATTATQPGAPTETITAGAGQISIAFADGALGGGTLQGHRILRGTGPGLETLLTSITSASPYVDNTVTPNVQYCYETETVTQAGPSAPSNEQCATATYPTGAALSLSTDGTTVATIGNSTFSWLNQASASLVGGGATPIAIVDPAHANTVNGSALVTKMATGAATYTAQINNCNTTTLYNSGLLLENATTGKLALFEDANATVSGSTHQVVTENNLLGAGASTLSTLSDAAAVACTPFWERISSDATNATFSYSQDGVTWHALYTTTLAAIGSPDHIGFYQDSDDTTGSGGPGTLLVNAWAATSGNTPAATGTPPATAPPAAPTGVAAAAGNGQIVITANPETAYPAFGTYNVYMSPVAGGESSATPITSVHLPYTIPGLTNGTQQCIELAGVNASGVGPLSTEVCATPAAVPSPPVISLSVVTGDINIAFTTFGSENGSPGQVQKIYRGTSPGTETYLGSTPSTISYDDRTVVAGQNYCYQASETNGIGEGAKSVEKCATAAGGSTATVTLNGVGFNWLNQVNNSTVTGGGSSPIVLSAPAATQNAYVSDLVTPTLGVGTYDFLVTIQNPGTPYYNGGVALVNNTTGQLYTFTEQQGTMGVESWTNYSSYNFNQIFNPIGGAPTAIIGTPLWMRVIYDGTNWSFWYSPDGIAGDFHEVLTETAATLGNPDHIGLEVLPSDGNSTGLPSSVTLTKYGFTSSATNGQAAAPGVTQTAQPPAAPTLTAASGTQQVTLTWTDGAANGSPIATHNVLRGTSASNLTLLASGVTGSSYNDTTGTVGTQYFYAVQAVNGSTVNGGVSANSNVASGTPQAAVVVGGSGSGQAGVTLTTDGAVALTFDGSTFSWDNQGGASFTGGGVNPVVLTDPVHQNSINAKALITKMLTGGGTYTVEMKMPDPDANYNAGMVFINASTGAVIKLTDDYANSSQSNIRVQQQINLQGGNDNDLEYGSYPPVAGSPFFLRWASDGTNVSFLYSLTGNANDFHDIYDTTVAALGSPDHVGFFMDSDWTDSYGGYNGTATFLNFQALTGSQPQAVAAGTDSTANFLTTPNIPQYNTPPGYANAVPDDGLQLSAGSTNYFDMCFGSNNTCNGNPANITDSTTFRKYIYTNYNEGNVDGVIGYPTDDGQGPNSAFFSVVRTYAVGDPNDLIPVEADGLHVKVLCNQNHTNCTNGNIYAGYYRTGAVIKPGMTVELDYIPPTGYFSWFTIWLYSGQELTSYPNTDLYSGGGVQQSGYPNFEVDINDDFPRLDNGGCVAKGTLTSPAQNSSFGGQLDFGTPNIYGTNWNTAPYTAFQSTANGWANQGYECNTNYIARSMIHLVMSWDQNTNLISDFVNGKLIQQDYMEYPQTQTAVYPDGSTQQMGMEWNIGGEAVPNFNPDVNGNEPPQNLIENEGRGEQGWGAIVVRQAAWYGTIANPQNYK